MELIKWSDKFSTGVPDVDGEHQELISQINSFYSKQKEGIGKSESVQILNDIYASIHAHFMLEERLMKKNAYDEYQPHKNDHAKLLDDIRDITMELEQTSKLDEEQLRSKLNDWFMIHFKTFDSRLHKLEQLIAAKKNAKAGLFTRIKNKLK